MFFFRRLGAFVCWNLTESERVNLKGTLKQFQMKPYPDDLVERENEQLTYLYKERDSNLVGGDIHLSSTVDVETKALEKYAFSNAMALSGMCIYVCMGYILIYITSVHKMMNTASQKVFSISTIN